MSDVVIRPARPDDAEAILALIRGLARFERAEHELKASAADLRRHGWGPDPAFEALLAERDGQPVGFALFFRNYSTWEGRPGLYLEDLYVTGEARGRGIGRRLVAAVAALAVARGYARLDLNVLAWNPARGFYAELGFGHLTEWLPYRLSGNGLHALAAAEPPPRPAG